MPVEEDNLIANSSGTGLIRKSAKILDIDKEIENLGLHDPKDDDLI